MRQAANIPEISEFRYRLGIGEPSCYLFLYGIGYSFVFLACFNLAIVRPIEPVSCLASVAWILIVALSTYFRCNRTGTQQYRIDTLGHFVRNRFIRLDVDENHEKILSVGFRFASHTFYTLKLKASGISEVHWSMGQGGVGDWDVAIWFDLSAVIFNAKNHQLGIVCIGKSTGKKKIERFGRRLITFLCEQGVELTLPDEKLLGQEGTTMEDFKLRGGRVLISENEVVAHPQYYPVKKGDKVVVSEIRGTSLYIKRQQPK